jgi:hypothetical protein
VTLQGDILMQLLNDSEIIEGDIFNNSNFRFRNTKESGIYVMFAEGDLPIYVGQTTNFKNRLHSHFRKQDIGSKYFVDFVEYIRVINIDAELLSDYERSFIKLLQPCFNGASGGSMKNMGKRFGYVSLYKEKKNAKTPAEIESLILQWREREIIETTELRSGDMNTKSDDLRIINAVREAIKLVVLHADEESKNDIIDGLLATIKAS